LQTTLLSHLVHLIETDASADTINVSLSNLTIDLTNQSAVARQFDHYGNVETIYFGDLPSNVGTARIALVPYSTIQSIARDIKQAKSKRRNLKSKKQT
jgi:hypothetical protein